MHWIESHKHVGVVVDVFVFGWNKWLYNTPVDFCNDKNHIKNRLNESWGHIYDLTDYKFLNSKVEQNVVPFYSEKKK